MFRPLALRFVRTASPNSTVIPPCGTATTGACPTPAKTAVATKAAMNQKPSIWLAVERGVGARELEKLIYQLGGNVNTCKPLTGETPIELAIKRQSSPLIVRLLVHAGAQTSKRVDRDGSSLLHLAAARSLDPKVIEILMRAGLKPSHRNFRMETPVHVAARVNPNPRVLETLLSRDADRDLVVKMNDLGQRPLDISAELNPDVARVIVQKGGDSNMSSYDWSPIYPQSRFDWGNTWK